MAYRCLSYPPLVGKAALGLRVQRLRVQPSDISHIISFIIGHSTNSPLLHFGHGSVSAHPLLYRSWLSGTHPWPSQVMQFAVTVFSDMAPPVALHPYRAAPTYRIDRIDRTNSRICQMLAFWFRANGEWASYVVSRRASGYPNRHCKCKQKYTRYRPHKKQPLPPTHSPCHSACARKYHKRHYEYRSGILSFKYVGAAGRMWIIHLPASSRQKRGR